jgi:hypothetical protein
LKFLFQNHQWDQTRHSLWYEVIMLGLFLQWSLLWKINRDNHDRREEICSCWYMYSHQKGCIAYKTIILLTRLLLTRLLLTRLLYHYMLWYTTWARPILHDLVTFDQADI